MRSTCAVYGCLSTSYGSNSANLKFHRFPKEKSRAREWIKASQRHDLINVSYKSLRNRHICNLHFEKKMYAKSQLKNTATPTINLPPPGRTIGTQTDPLVFQDDAIRSIVGNPSEPRNIPPQEQKAIGREDLEGRSEDLNIRQQYKICGDQFVASSSGVKTMVEPTEAVYVKEEAVVDDEGECENVEEDATIEERVTPIEIEIKPESDWMSDNGCREWLPNPPQFGNVDAPTTYSLFTQTDFNITCESCQKAVNPLSLPSSLSSSSGASAETTDPLVSAALMNRKNNLDQQQVCICQRLRAPGGPPQCFEGEVTILTNTNKILITIKKQLSRIYEGPQYDTQYKLMAMKFFLTSPVAYRLLYKTLNLPSENELRKRKIFFGTNLSEDVVMCLQTKVSFISDSEKTCVLSAGEISLESSLFYKIDEDKIYGFHDVNDTRKPVRATRAVVLMARGLFADWKQPLAYCFLNPTNNYSELSSWLDITIAKIMDTGLNVLAFTSDGGTIFNAIAKIKNVSADNPFFYVNNKRIYYIFDVPRLLGSIRINLMTNDFVFNNAGGVRASWQDVQDLYDVEKGRSYRMANWLTERHARGRGWRLGAAAMSRSVAIAITCCVEMGLLPERALGTAAFIQLINDMFDLLNSSPGKETYLYKKPFTQEEYQVEVFQKVLLLLKNISIVRKADGRDVTSVVKCLKHLEITIKAVMGLSTDLKMLKFGLLFTRRLNRSDLDCLFVSLRKRQVADCRGLTPIRFAMKFKRYFLTHLFRDIGGQAHRGDDLIRFLACIDSMSNKKKLIEISNNKKEANMLPVATIDYRFKLPQKKTFHFVCEYLLRKCLEVHKHCKRMEVYVTKYGKNSKETEEFQQYVMKIDQILVAIFETGDLLLRSSVGNRILEKLEQIGFLDRPCECFPVRYLPRLYFRFRIYNILKHNSRLLKQEPTRQQVYFEIPAWV